MKESGATITMQDMVKYYDNLLKNAGDDLPEGERRYITELRDSCAAGTLAVSSQLRSEGGINGG
jgi:hypothetical protein